LKLFILAFSLSVLFTWLAIIIAKKANIVDSPDRESKIHTKPVPLLGGVALFLAYATALLLNYQFSWELKGVAIASFIVMLSGLIDDVRGLSASARLVIQILCAIVVVAFGVRINIVPDRFFFAYPLEAIITVIWIVGITNAMNFIDGADGLAAGLTAIAAGAFAIIAYQTGQIYFAFLNAALAGACLGFLVFNFHPAKIFLGDAGSAFLGFSIASLAAMGEWSGNMPIVALSIPLLTLSILIFDMIYISMSRIARKKVTSFKEWIEYVGKDHLHHRLMNMGFSQVQTVLFIYLIAIVFALGALALKESVTYQALLLLSQGVCILVTVMVLMIVGRGNMEKNRITETRLK